MISMIKFIGRHFITIVLVIAALIMGGYISGKVDTVRDFFFPQSEVSVRSPVIMVNQIKAVAELVTVNSELGTIDIEVEIHRGFLNAGYYSASHIAIGAIDAGIDFEKIDKYAIELRNDVYSITLPAPMITSCRIEYIDQNQHSFTLLPADWDMVRQIAHAEALDEFAQRMIEKGILERAAEEAEFRIGEFVMNLTGLASRFEFQERTGEPELPDSCLSIPPSGWEKADGAWRQAS